ncbi:MAG: UDP-N-acetylmuramoyl-tripeptide--D-alanyl-D-alanine ligase [Bacteroidales bacterium]|jgi:UDP-N-acetylmuramoyl-tripeptide--D-alanyl-D-alanine ligase|nr:UDP-N-acetylmuramoyl-tripeptide--D-alanyl-D-alanine ligase [Bacteroidales bacterium]MDD2263643.1 UDP-N-acetylmuramoyl-tripeptide--D-alanyl-D-alanine ligase [Bacteroidales bacterium]MDD2830566.1 UDP-N-acetylmuramoyl-tripeptide--D-alanyl-D-alanine ligase [Bacteroidales bacterium]MDD3208835.1 UDP-N-acetylmuramoyl-tripeptide--D-alanyl-D-alanine ligase [Bacteroidales bacterium]MDD3697440.1 UDP-N-acetylmuramoyl-tripeptide--D-alanyl-D-alanine ligase [Bacteroidales bacterium]
MERLYAVFEKYPRICTDTRQINPGCLFFALKGERFDGNQFAGEALEKGAAYAVVDNYQGTDPRCIRVPDVLRALQDLAAMHRSGFRGPVFALTGSNGKTTTKELIHAVLSVNYRVTATQGNLNNHIGVPLSILKMNRDTEVGLFEMGASHPGEIAFLTEIVRPTAGLITNVSGSHLEGFGDLEGVMRCKGALYDYLASTGGTVFCHVEDPVLTGMLLERKIMENVVPYGIKRQGVKAWLQEGFLIFSLKGYPDITTHLAGLYNVPNVLAALAVAEHYRIERTKAVQAVASYVPSNNRSQWIKTSRNSLIADAYNANPVSMTLALENLASLDGRGKVAILGDMLELGPVSAREHLGIVRMVEKMDLEKVFWVGPYFTQAVHQNGAKGFCFPKVENLIDHLKKNPLEGNIVLIKGSNGIRLRELIASGVC